MGISSLIIWTLCLYVSCCSCLHLKGTFRTGDFFLFLSKFGFRKSNDRQKSNSLGYIYGNITSNDRNSHHKALLVVVNREYFLDYYRKRPKFDIFTDDVCSSMFEKIDTVSYDKQCNVNGTEDFLLHVPCPAGNICADVTQPMVNNHQFTFAIENRHQARFWYVSLVACHWEQENNRSCSWKESGVENLAIDYDIHLVNDNPYTEHNDPLKFELSFDQQGMVEMYLGLLCLYFILLPLQLYANFRQRHHITRLFTTSLFLQMCCTFFSTMHLLLFALDGIGLEVLDVIGDVLHSLSQSLFMLLLLLLAKGWAITRTELTSKLVLFCVWLLYTCVGILLYVWNMTEVDVIDDIDEYQTFPGWIILIFRLGIMVWFLYELRSTMLDENERAKLRFYVHFGAGILVWFVYLPVVALIALKISALWRAKLLLGITSSADFMAFSIMAHLLWPTRSEQYFQLASESDPGEELEEFNEAPHNIPRPQKV